MILKLSQLSENANRGSLVVTDMIKHDSGETSHASPHVHPIFRNDKCCYRIESISFAAFRCNFYERLSKFGENLLNNRLGAETIKPLSSIEVRPKRSQIDFLDSPVSIIL